MPGNDRSWGFNVSEHLTYMINIALTQEFALDGGS
jgi:hypothetical protein